MFLSIDKKYETLSIYGLRGGLELDYRENNECSTLLLFDVVLDGMEDVGYYSTGPYLMY